ncbi:dihydroxy-acid dehydratase [Desulfotomaculum arcticum]|uniref:Dihydroxy-acid dehydratase n=1 Tax=Desulfotruncus arcticus DSM 17038 TaxID=1121424 RepID=A0A1I2YG55_9FIRM|nr:dihydroxy-acid dehydratase [Desulfotruncus arcticus]SFH24633.1 dihydroxy-acid dehydratase [Desulfotomaculum arcticum] [Desulfotruncus arcticus DSM 17038]
MLLRSKELKKVAPEIDALRRGMDWHQSDLDRPVIIIESTCGSSHPGSYHLNYLVEEVEKGVIYNQGKAANFTVTDICDGIAQGHEGMNYSLLSREMMAGMTEIHVRANAADGLVLISSCDKAVPAHLMVAGRLKIPAIHVPGGTMLTGPNGMTLEQIGSFGMMHQKGEIAQEAFADLQASACPSCGACQFMGTAGTMQIMSEALGLALPGTAVAPTAIKPIKEMARDAGYQIVELVAKGITTRDILTYEAFYNAVVIHAAISGSTNALLHLPAIAREAGVGLNADLFDQVNRKVPYLVNVRPAGRYSTEYFWYAGGVPALMLELRDYLHLDVLTCTGKTLGENLELIKNSGWLARNNGYLNNYGLKQENIIHPLDKPIQPEGSMAVLKGNVAPEGSVVKHSAINPAMLVHTGPAKVFSDELAAREAVLSGVIKPGDVVVVRYAGPKGSGMPEMFYTTEVIASDPELVATTAIITDGRFSGATRGPAVGHISPEAAEGGPIALIEQDDLIKMDIPNRSINLVGSKGRLRSQEEIAQILAERRKKWKKPEIINSSTNKGILGIYKKLATSAMSGGYMEVD